MYNRKIPVDSVETDVLLILLAVDNALKPNENIGDSDDNRFSLDTLEAASSALERVCKGWPQQIKFEGLHFSAEK